MLLNRKGCEMLIDLDHPEDALGLFAVLTGNPASVLPETYAKGQRIYQWFFESVQVLASNYEAETATKYRKTHLGKY